jgi:hypothetical protein
MSALTFLDINPEFNTFTVTVIFASEELFLAFESVCTFAGLWYEREKLGYPVLLLLLGLCTKLYYVVS